MPNPQQERMEKAIDQALTEPTTIKDRIVAIAIGLAAVAFGVATWLWPDYIASQKQTPSGRRGHLYFLILSLLWNRPVGSIAIIVGLTAFFGAFRKSKSGTGTETSKQDHPPKASGQTSNVPNPQNGVGQNADFDRLAAECRSSGSRESMDQLWRAVYGLEQWHFVPRGEMEPNTIRPFVGVVDGKPFVFAFTDDRRAHAFAVRQKLQMGEGAFPILSMQTRAAVNYVHKFGEQGVFGILFNDGPNGFFAPLTNVLPMARHFGLEKIEGPPPEGRF